MKSFTPHACLTFRTPWSTKTAQSTRKYLSFHFNGHIMAPGGRFSKVPIINGLGKLFPFTLKIEVSIVLHVT